VSRSSRPAVTAAAGAAVLTAALVASPGARLAYHGPLTHLVLETAAALIASLAAFLAAGRLWRTGARSDFLIAGGLLVLAATNASCSVIAPLVDGAPRSLTTWASLAGATAGLATLAAGALAPPARIAAPARAVALSVAFAAAATAVIVVAAIALDGRLPEAVDPSLAPAASVRPDLEGVPGVLVLQLVCAALSAAAAVGFTRRAGRDGDAFLRWLGVALVLGFASRVNYAMFPSLYDEWVYTGDLFRLGTYLVVFAAALREIAAYQRRLADVAVLAERHRIARDLHDGMAQELAYAVATLRTRAEEEDAGDAELATVRTALEQALLESRAAIEALDSSDDVPFPALLEQTARVLGARGGAHMVCHVDPGLDVPPATAKALVRITREAVANAARHGRAEVIRVRLWEDGDLHLQVDDDGHGFDLRDEWSGFGLRSMHDRARAAGGTMALESTPGEGTTVRVTVPGAGRALISAASAPR
jgi:signal transduction histidine kinase